MDSFYSYYIYHKGIKSECLFLVLAAKWVSIILDNILKVHKAIQYDKKEKNDTINETIRLIKKA
jgi:hypothetical protein